MSCRALCVARSNAKAPPGPLNDTLSSAAMSASVFAVIPLVAFSASSTTRIAFHISNAYPSGRSGWPVVSSVYAFLNSAANALFSGLSSSPDQGKAVVIPIAACFVADRTWWSASGPGPASMNPAARMPATFQAATSPSASSVTKAANTFFAGWDLIAAMTFAQSAPLFAGTVIRPEAVPPFFARPAMNAAADSVPKASSPLTTKKSRRPFLDTHSPSGSLICQDGGAPLRRTDVRIDRRLGEWDEDPDLQWSERDGRRRRRRARRAGGDGDDEREERRPDRAGAPRRSVTSRR